MNKLKSNGLHEYITIDLDTNVNRLSKRIHYKNHQRIDNWIRRKRHPKELPLSFYLLVEEEYGIKVKDIYLGIMKYAKFEEGSH